MYFSEGLYPDDFRNSYKTDIIALNKPKIKKMCRCIGNRCIEACWDLRQCKYRITKFIGLSGCCTTNNTSSTRRIRWENQWQCSRREGRSFEVVLIAVFGSVCFVDQEHQRHVCTTRWVWTTSPSLVSGSNLHRSVSADIRETHNHVHVLRFNRRFGEIKNGSVKFVEGKVGFVPLCAAGVHPHSRQYAMTCLRDISGDFNSFILMMSSVS